MYPYQHILGSLTLSLVLLPTIGPTNSLIIFLSGFLFDIDHYFYDIIKKKHFSIFKAYKYRVNSMKGLIRESKREPEMHIFHTLEFFILLIAEAFIFPILIYIIIGLAFHMLLDIISGIINKTLKCRSYSIIQFILLRTQSN